LTIVQSKTRGEDNYSIWLIIEAITYEKTCDEPLMISRNHDFAENQICIIAGYIIWAHVST
jgi:hypothetical protein